MSFLNELSQDARSDLNFKLTDCTLLNANEIQKNMLKYWEKDKNIWMKKIEITWKHGSDILII